MGINRTIIHGPPGTGKTFRLVNHHLEHEITKLKTDPQKIIYITFSNAAATEARDERINHNLLYVSTMHSLGTRECNMDTKKNLLKSNKKWRVFKNYPNHEAYANMSFVTKLDASGNPTYENDHMQIIQYARSKKIDLQESAIQLGKHESVDIDFTIQLEQDLKTFKEHTGMIEFSDMIKLFIKRKKCPDIEAVFLDEAQDLNPLQWEMFFYIENQCKRSYIAGDDDQTIYGFQGAEPNIFVNLQGKFDPQEDSHRVPRKVHKKALEVISQITKENRVDKKWNARDSEGEVLENMYLDEIDFSEGKWMILAQTNKLLEEIGEFFYGLGIRFTGKVNSALPNEVLQAYQTWVKLNNGIRVSNEDAKAVYEQFLKSTAGHVKHGFSSGKTLDHVENVNLQELKDNHGLLVTGSWEQFSIEEDIKNYMKTLLEKKDDLMKDTRIELSTMHGSKGRECENVLVFPDYGTENQFKPYLEAINNPDAQHRLVYVAVTRAKNKLYLMAPLHDDKEFYTIGGIIE